MRGPGVYKRCGVSQETGRRWGQRCPRLAQRDHGCWYFTVDLPVGRDGGRRRLRRGGFATRAAVGQARAYWLGADVDPDLSLVTVGQWLDVWLETRQTLRLGHARDLCPVDPGLSQAAFGRCAVA